MNIKKYYKKIEKLQGFGRNRYEDLAEEEKESKKKIWRLS